MPRKKYSNCESYLTDIEPEARRRINIIRKLVKDQVPEMKEVINYNIPSFKTTKVFMHVAAFKAHIGVYPPVRNDARLLQTLKPYRNEKGNLRFNLDTPLPTALLVRVIKALVSQVEQ